MQSLYRVGGLTPKKGGAGRRVIQIPFKFMMEKSINLALGIII